MQDVKVVYEKPVRTSYALTAYEGTSYDASKVEQLMRELHTMQAKLKQHQLVFHFQRLVEQKQLRMI
ncbi:hypothetical protein DXA21_21550 [Parabacteroides distasonis]|nr:hypothetical protein DXA21_21550 [Parabacteroides distasonis]